MAHRGRHHRVATEQGTVIELHDIQGRAAGVGARPGKTRPTSACWLAVAAVLFGLASPAAAQTGAGVASDTQDLGTALPGAYVFTPPANAGYAQNAWHFVTIVRQGAGYRWTNRAGAGWNLTLDMAGLKLRSGPDNPYYAQYPGLRDYTVVVTNGQLTGVRIGADLYARTPAAALVAAPAAPLAAVAAPAAALSAGPVTLLGAHGRFVGAEGNGAAAATRAAAGASEQLFLITNADGSVSFRSAYGKYLVAEIQGVMNANRDAIGPWEKFALIRNADGTVSLKTAHGKYVVAEADGRLNANRDQIGPWESFRLVQAAGAGGAASPTPAQAQTMPAVAAAVPGFYMAIMSDAQYPRSAFGPNAADESSDNNPALSEANNRNHVKSINALAAALGPGRMVGVIINGDLTEYGHSDEYDKYVDMYKGLAAGTVYPGLGNHDYANNVDNCYQNNCANRMVLKMAATIKALRPANFDYRESIGDYKFPEIVNTYEGSLAYSWDIGHVHFVQLHNYPTYERSWSNYISSVTVDGGPGARRYDVNIKSAMSWLRNDLARARNAGQAIILNYHDPEEHWLRSASPALRDEFAALLRTYQVSAVFGGHIHNLIGRQPTAAAYGSVPVFYSGSSIRNKYLLVRFAADSMEVQHVSSLNGGTDRTTDATVYPLYHPKPQAVLPVPPASGYVIFKNEAGYVSRYYVSFTSGGKAQTLSTGNLSLGNRVRLELPGDATNIVLTGEGKTGLLDSSFFGTHAWNTTFRQSYAVPPNLCFKSYGTTLNQSWNTNCN